MTSKAGFSLADIERQVARTDAVPFEPLTPSGDQAGVTLLIYSDQHPQVVADLRALRDERTRREQIIAAQQRTARPGEVIITAEEDDTYTAKLTAVRLAGWQGIDDEPTPEAKVRLLSLVPTFIPQVLTRAAKLASFTKTSPKT